MIAKLAARDILDALARLETRDLLRIRDEVDRILDPDHPSKAWDDWDDEEVDRYYANLLRSAERPQ